MQTLLGAGHNRKAEKNHNRCINGVNYGVAQSGCTERRHSILPRQLNLDSLLLELIVACLAEHQLRKWIRSVFSAAPFLLMLLPALANCGLRVA